MGKVASSAGASVHGEHEGRRPVHGRGDADSAEQPADRADLASELGILRKDSDPHKIVGTGPFRLADYVKNDRLVVERFDNYWNTRRMAQARRINFRFVPDLNTRLLALRSGEVDIVGEVTPDATREVEGSPGLRLVKSGPGASGRIDFNIAGIEPFTLGKDGVIREAVALGIDRNAVIQTVYQGNADTSPLSRTLFGSSADVVKGCPSSLTALANFSSRRAGVSPKAGSA